jgi:hypothetical protein
MLQPFERDAIDDAFTAARATLGRIDAAFSEWRNVLSWVGIADDATERMRPLADEAHAEWDALQLERDRISAAPGFDPDAVPRLLARANRLASSTAAADIERIGKGEKNAGAIVGDVLHDVGGNVANAVDGAAAGLGDVGEAAGAGIVDTLKRTVKGMGVVGYVLVGLVVLLVVGLGAAQLRALFPARR